MRFKDHFSDASGDYAAFRPTYPDALFAWLTEQCRGREVAWDCATGSGQAARGLAKHFRQVIATDASAEQIAHASGPETIRFRVAPAEASGLPDCSVDLITVAQAAHWFDLPRFYAEAKRVLRPGGMLALWGYGRLVLPGALDVPFERFYRDTLGAYWPPERKLIDDSYRTLVFPLDEVQTPEFFIEVIWDLSRLLAYVSTWSAVKRFEAAMGANPLPALEAGLAPLWGAQRRPLALKWPLFLRAGLLEYGE